MGLLNYDNRCSDHLEHWNIWRNDDTDQSIDESEKGKCKERKNMKNSMRKVIASIMTVLVLLTMISYEALALTTSEKEQKYNQTLEELESFLESPNDKGRSLKGIINSFVLLDNFQYSRKLSYYTSALQKIIDGEFDIKYGFWIDRMIADAEFCEFVSESDYEALYVPDVLKTYGEGRKAELEKDYQTAMDLYQKCGNFYDSSDRLEDLFEKLFIEDIEQAYIQANALLEENNLGEAYYAFAKCKDKNYRDSAEWMSYIVEKLGYIPTTSVPEAENPTESLPASTEEKSDQQTEESDTADDVAFELKMKNNVRYIMIEWAPVSGASSYIVKRRTADSSYSEVDTTSGTSYRDTHAAANCEYIYVVTAKLADGTTVDSKEITIKMESKEGASAKYSDWVTKLPAGVKAVETKQQYRRRDIKTEYRYRDLTTQTSTNSQLGNGWTQIKAEKVYGSWSNYSETPISASSTLEVQESTEERKTEVTVWRYTRWEYELKGGNPNYVDSSCVDYSKQNPDAVEKVYGWKSRESREPYTSIGNKGGCNTWIDSSGNWWFNEKKTTKEVTEQVKVYRSRSVSMQYTYQGWGSWSDWSGNVVSGSNARQVETRNGYGSWSEWQDSSISASGSVDVEVRTLYRYRIQ